MPRVSARNEYGTIVFKGIDDRPIDTSSPDRMMTRRQDLQSRLTQQHSPTVRTPSKTGRAIVNEVAPPQDDDDGPNDRGTYSKDYVSKHPETIWIHRGQGRYLPESALGSLANNVPHLQIFTASDRRSSRQTLRRRRVSVASLDDDDDEVVVGRRHHSPPASRTNDSPYSLRRRPSIQSQTEIDSRESRALRRSNQFTLINESQSTEDIEDDKTYTKSYVDSHPEQRFRHCGNGFYRRISDTFNGQPESYPTQTSTQFSVREHIGTRSRRQFGRRESAASLASTTSQATGSAVDHSDSSNMESLTKQQMLDYQARHPGVHFIHRGNGRYKRIDDVKIQVAQQAAMDPEDKITYSKEYVEAHPEQEFHHCGYGRYKRGPKTVQPNNVSSNEDGQEIPDGLVTKEYVDAHPEFLFHHRGQGRYALGPRAKGIQNGTGSPSPSTADSEAAIRVQREKLYDREYVDAHPEETFHHRGQGRWAKGLPPPGSSNKMAVRGPGVAMTRTSTTSSSTEVQYNEDEVPGLFDLVTKAEGPDLYRDVGWYYRGGGKWSRSTRAEQIAHENAARSKVRPLSDYVASPAMSREPSSSRRGSQQSQPTLKRKHSALQQSDHDVEVAHRSKESSQQRSLMSIDDDYILDEDLPQVYRSSWPRSTEEERNDKVYSYMRDSYTPLADIDDFVRLMTKHDISSRPTETLVKIAAHCSQAMKRIQDEYLRLDALTAPQARIPRKVATGGRLPVDPMIYEDRKEAELYDYQFDPKRIGYQDPEGQKITRDAEGRELRKRRRRGDLDTEGMPDEPLPRRAIKPVNRFDGVPGSTSRKIKTTDATKQDSVPPDRVPTPRAHPTEAYVAPSSGRWANHVPKRIKELRGSNLGRHDGANDSADDEDMADAPSDGIDL